MAYQRLGEMLLSAGIIDANQLERALEEQRRLGGRLGDILVRNGAVNEAQLIGLLSKQLGVDPVDLDACDIPGEMALILSRETAERLRVVPIKEDSGALFLAMSDPTDLLALSEVRSAAGKRVVPLIARTGAIDRAISVLYGNIDAAQAIAMMRAESGSSEARNFDFRDISPTAGELPPVVRLVNGIIARGIKERASDIHFEPREGSAVVRMRVDGLLRRMMTIPRELSAQVVSRIKVMADMDLAEKRAPQDGRAAFELDGLSADLRISTIPTVLGEKVSVRILDKNARPESAEALGLFGEEREKYRRLLGCPDGMVLMTGPTGSGKSSTMYSMINGLNSERVNLVTLEDPVEYRIDGVNQVQINEKAGMTFASGLRAVLRQDPDIIAVGEIRDRETADIALRAAITGHLVLSTVHTADALSLITRLEDIGCEPYMIAEALRSVISQRLVRKICPECRREYSPDEDELRRLGLSGQSGIKLFRGIGCPSCYHTGYSGRTAVFEIMILSGRTKRLIAERRPGHEISEQVRREGRFKSLRENALELVLSGVTTSDEFTRILAADSESEN